MHTDRTTKLLLALIAAGLWVQILTPAFVPKSATAQGKGEPIKVNIVEVGGFDTTVGKAIPIEGGPLAQKPVRVQVAK